MKSICVACLSICFITLQSCDKEVPPFSEPILLNEWIVEGYYDVENGLIHEKPEGLPRNIVLVFRSNNIVTGFVATFSIDGTYNYAEDGSFEIQLNYPRSGLCCDWDELFLDTYSEIESYEYDDGNALKLFYNNGDNYISLYRS